MTRLAFVGDVHHQFDAVNAAVLAQGALDGVFFVGDFSPTRPLQEHLAPLLNAGIDLWWIAGNHDADDAAQYEYTFGSALATRRLQGQVVDVAGVRVGGLGGNFSEAVWYPPGPPRHRSREEFLATCGNGNRWRGGLPRRRRMTIFPEDMEALVASGSVDVLVTHEASGTHRHGFPVLDELARRLGARLLVHGHVHESYEAETGGVGVRGLGLAEVWVLQP